MGAPALQWQIEKSRLPDGFKRILHTLALWADVEQGYANIYASKPTMAEFAGRGERAVREACSDLVRFGVLLIVEPSADRKSKRETQYQISIERLATWTDADSRQVAEFRRGRRPGQGARAKTKAKGESQPGSPDPGQPGSPDPGSEHESIDPTRIARSGLPGSPDPPDPDRPIRQRTPSDLISRDSTVAERGSAPEHAVENSAASGAVSPGSVPRPKAGFVYIDNPSSTRHRQQSAYYATLPPGSSLGYHVLAEHGRKLLAGYGLGEIDWSEIRSDLRSCARRSGIDQPDLIRQVEDSLRVQHAHFVASGTDLGAPA